MVKSHEKRFLHLVAVLVTLLIIIIAGIAVGVGKINHWYQEQVRKDQQSAKEVAIARAKDACLGLTQSKNLCDNMEVTISESECNARVCWNVYVAPENDNQTFYASMTIERNEADYFISRYFDSTHQ